MKMQHPQIRGTIGIANTNRRSSQDVLATRRANAEIALDRAFNCRHLVKSVWTLRRSDRRYTRPGHSVSVVGGLVTAQLMPGCCSCANSWRSTRNARFGLARSGRGVALLGAMVS